MTIEIFKTDVDDKAIAKKIITSLQNLFPEFEANFDLEDSDRILRVASSNAVNIGVVIETINGLGYTAILME